MIPNSLLYSYIILNEKFFSQFVENTYSKFTLTLTVINNENSDSKSQFGLIYLTMNRSSKINDENELSNFQSRKNNFIKRRKIQKILQ